MSAVSLIFMEGGKQMISRSLVNTEVYNVREGTTAKIVAVGQDSISLEVGKQKIPKVVTARTFERWYKIIPQDKPEKENKETKKPSRKKVQTKDLENSTKGEALLARFIQIIKQTADEGEILDFTYKELNNKVIVKYNYRNVFEIYVSRARLIVYAHPKSLTPINKKFYERLVPKEWGWPLSAKYVFEELDERREALMRSIVVDGLFYRSTRNKEE